MSLNTAVYEAVQRDLTIVFNLRAQAAEPFYPLLCTIQPSKGADEKYGWLGSLPGIREWIGPRQFKQLRAADYTLRNKDWELSLEFEKKDVDDDRMGSFRTVIGSAADEAMFHPDELLFDVVNAAESQPCFDGQYFFDTDHSWGDSGVQSNLLTYDAVNPAAVTAAEFKAAYHAALLRMLGYKNDQGRYLVRPKAGKLGDLVVTVPLPLYQMAVTAFEQVLINQGETNVVLEKPTVIPVQYYSASDKFDLYYTGGLLKPYVFQARQPLAPLQFKGADDQESRTLKAMTSARYNVGFLAWWTAVRTQFN